MEKNLLRERLDAVADILEIKIEEISDILGYKDVKSYRSTKYQGKGLTVSQLTRLAEAYPTINLNWLFTGIGNPLSYERQDLSKLLSERSLESFANEPVTEYNAVKMTSFNKMENRIEEIYELLLDIRTKMV